MCKLYYSLVVLLCCLAITPGVSGLSREDSLSRYERLDSSDLLSASFSYKVGEQVLNQLAVLKVPQGYRLLEGDQARVLVEQLWGNPENPNTLGVLIPQRVSPTDKEVGGIIISFEPTGYLNDDDAQRINYNRLLYSMKEELQEDNLLKGGRSVGAIKTVDWAFPPYFNKSNHSLHLAKVFKFESKLSPFLNYEVRLLGRNGALCLTAIGKASDLQKIKAQLESVLEYTQFTFGNRYEDFNPLTDRKSSWGQDAPVLPSLFFSKEKLVLVLRTTLLLILICLGMTGFVFLMQIYHHRRATDRKNIKINFDMNFDERLN